MTRTLIIVTAAMTLMGCSDAAQWQGRVYSSKAPQTEFIPIGTFRTPEQCRDAGTALMKQMSLGRNGQASQDYSDGKTVCTRV